MSVGTVYHHFQNRNAAVAELLMQSFQGDIALIKPLIDTAVNGGMSLRELALTFVETIVENAVQHHHLYAAVFRDSDLPVSLVNRMKNDLALVARDVATVLQRHPECHVPDVAMAATFLVRLVDHLTDLYLLTDELHARRQEDFVTELAWLITAYLTTPREGDAPGNARPPSMPAAV
jgi:AcrR family transcriptional regulator